MKTKTRRARAWPVRLGPEWWALYAARFSALWTSHVASHGFDAADRMRSCHAESAAACADRGILAFREAVESEAIGLKSKRSRGTW